MATITAAMVKELRETTGVGMMDCKQALPKTTVTCRLRLTGCARRDFPGCQKGGACGSRGPDRRRHQRQQGCRR